VLTQLQVFGLSLDRPTAVLQGRLLRLSGTVRF
jgi:hypothetical protein